MRHHAPRQGVTTPGSECSRQVITHRHQRMRPAIRGDHPPRGTLSHGRHRSAEWINTDAPALGLSPSLEVERGARLVSVAGVHQAPEGGRSARSIALRGIWLRLVLFRRWVRVASPNRFGVGQHRAGTLEFRSWDVALHAFSCGYRWVP